jgi:hypothetical protein
MNTDESLREEKKRKEKPPVRSFSNLHGSSKVQIANNRV